MIIVDPFVICRRGGGCIWIRSKLSECDMCSMRQGHRATGQTCQFSHPFLLHHATFGFQKLDFLCKKKIDKNRWRNSVQSEKSNNFWEKTNDVYPDPPASLQGKFIQGVNSITSRARQGTHRYAYSPTILYQKL